MALIQVQAAQVIDQLPEVKTLTREEVIAKYGHYTVLMLSFERLVFTYSVRIVRSNCELRILVTVGDGTPEGICGLKITEFGEPVQISSLKFEAVEVYEYSTSGVRIIEEY